MTFSAFITTLFALSAPTSRTTTTATKNQPRPRMLPCDDKGKCPAGSQCLKLFSKFGVCVLDDQTRLPGP